MASDDAQEELLPGLPDDIALRCLARLSHGYACILRAVSRRWKAAFDTGQVARMQAELGSCGGDWLLVLPSKSLHGHWIAFDPDADLWYRLPPAPLPGAEYSNHTTRKIRHRGFGCVVAARNMFVIGGFYASSYQTPYFATSQVLKFDLVTKQWSQAASLRVARCNFACALVSQDKVVVAGGCSSSRGTPFLDSAEVYDVTTNRWEDLPPLPVARDLCQGVALDGRFYVFGGVPDAGDAKQVHFYDLSTKSWHSTSWLLLGRVVGTVMSNKLYLLEEWSGAIQVFVNNTWSVLGRVVVSRCALDRGLAGLRGKLYLFGGRTVNWNPDWTTEIVQLNDLLLCDPSTVMDGNITCVNGRSMASNGGAPIGYAVYQESS